MFDLPIYFSWSFLLSSAFSICFPAYVRLASGSFSLEHASFFLSRFVIAGAPFSNFSYWFTGWVHVSWDLHLEAENCFTLTKKHSIGHFLVPWNLTFFSPSSHCPHYNSYNSFRSVASLLPFHGYRLHSSAFQTTGC